MMSRSMLWMAAAVTAVGACHGGSGDAGAMIDEFRSSVGELRTLTDDHATMMDGATEMSAMAAIEAEHRDLMRATEDQLGAVADRLAMCERLCCIVGAGMLRGMTREMDHHRDAMARAADVTRAREEEARHQHEIRADLDDLDRDHAQMMRMMGMHMGMGCPADDEVQ